MALPVTRSNFATPSHNYIPTSNLGSKVDDARKDVLSILKDTDWPAKATQDVQDFIETMETRLNLHRIPTDDAQIQGGLRIAIEHFLKELESVRGRLTEKSRKYDTKKKGLREEVATWFSGATAGDCTVVLRNCRADVERGLTSLNDHLKNLAINSEQRTSHETRSNSEENARFIAEGSVGVTAEKQKKTSLLGELLNGAKITFKLAEGVSGPLPVVGGYLGAVAKVGSTIVEMVQAMDDNDETAKRLGTHVVNLSKVLDRVCNQPRQPEEGQTTDGIEGLRRGLKSLQLEVETLQSQSGLKKFWYSYDQTGSLKKLQEKVRTALEEIQLLLNLNTSILVAELHNESTQNKHGRLLDRLGDGKFGARGNAIEDVTCLPGTRVEILERIDNWIRGNPNSGRVLWIRGMAGRGKSTIASTVAQRWKDRACCATYYFRRGQNPTNSPLVCALAKQLARSLDPEIKNAILSTVEKNEDIINHRLDEQFTALFVSSLRPFKEKASPILIIVDALDECDSVDYAVNFVKLIHKYSSSLPDNLKFLLTSRPEAPLLRALEPRKWHAESLDSIANVNADVEQFVRHAFSQVKEEHGIEGDWPAPDDLSKLAAMSQGLFQWARTVVKYVSNGSPTYRLRELLQSPQAWSGVDELYTQILSKALEGPTLNSEKRNLLLGLLGTLVAAPYPVSLEVIIFLHPEYDWGSWETSKAVFDFFRQEILADLNSLLFIPVSPAEPIRLMHTSIRDLLVDRERCGDRPYWVDLAGSHQRLKSACIRQMNRHLRENICNLSDLTKPSSEVQDIVERELCKGIQYCCRAWSIHLMEGRWRTEPAADVLDRHEAGFESFSKEKILFWLEVMSLIGSPTETITAAKRVCDWLSQHPNVVSRPSLLATLWNDVRRFIAAFSEPISFGPLHIYASALAHCPPETELWKRYSSYAKVRTIRGLQGSTWPSNLWTRSTGSRVFSVSFSPDGSLLTVGSKDGTICLCDPQTGRQVGEPMEGHSSWVNSVCFSLDGKLLASGSSDETILLWDPQTWKQIGEPLAGHTDWVKSVRFSPDGRLLASGSNDKTIRLWDPQTWKQIGKSLTGHTDWVNSICFSPDGRLLASGSSDKTIRLWDPQTWKQIGEPLIGHTDSVNSVCFSPDGKLLASGSNDQTIRLWDPQRWKQIGEPLTGHTSSVSSVCFSSDGKLLASGSDDQAICLWAPQTGKQLGEPLTGHTSSVSSVCFSPDNKLLASGSDDKTIRLWDPQPGKQVSEPLTGHTDWVNSVCFSSDGTLLASGSNDETIRLWDPQTGKQLGEPLTGHSGWVNFVCFSPDGKLLASGSSDKTIRLWDPQTGKQLGRSLTGHTGWVNSICFSPANKLLASGSHDKTIRLWDPRTGKQVGKTLRGHTSRVSSVCFSPDGKRLASASEDETIRLWDLQTGMQVGDPLKGPDSHRIRSDSSTTPIIWDNLAPQRPSITRVTSVFLEGHWMTLSPSYLFWLAPQYWLPRPQIMTLSGGKLVVSAEMLLHIFDVSGVLE